jgi:16S rRNA (guanine527-N7)-methyltransferase
MNRKMAPHNIANSSNEALRLKLPRLLAPYGVDVSDELAALIVRYVSILTYWNKKVNLTSVRDEEAVVQRHFGESFFAARVVGGDLRGRLADVGTGAGFPGLALKLLRPELHVLLVESNTKKVAFLAEVQRHLGLAGVEILRKQLKDVWIPAGTLDFVTARAVGRFDELLAWAHGALNGDGRLLLWLGAADASHITANTAWNWEAPVPIPLSQRRCILAGLPQ